MKKALAVILLIGLLFALSGCQSPTEKILNDVADIPITIDQDSVDRIQQGIESGKDGQ